MSVYAPTPEKGNDSDPRSRNLFLGIDADGAHHIYQTRFDRVVVVDPDSGIVHVQDLGEKDVDDWMVHVEDDRQWDVVNYIAEGVPLRIIDPAKVAEDGR